MDESELQEIRRRHEAATPGKWRIDQGATHLEIRAPYQQERSVARVYCDIDADFIAHARQDVPALLAEVDRLRECLILSR